VLPLSGLFLYGGQNFFLVFQDFGEGRLVLFDHALVGVNHLLIFHDGLLVCQDSFLIFYDCGLVVQDRLLIGQSFGVGHVFFSPVIGLRR
jgi:hypothetical protein